MSQVVISEELDRLLPNLQTRSYDEAFDFDRPDDAVNPLAEDGFTRLRWLGNFEIWGRRIDGVVVVVTVEHDFDKIYYDTI